MRPPLVGCYEHLLTIERWKRERDRYAAALLALYTLIWLLSPKEER